MCSPYYPCDFLSGFQDGRGRDGPGKGVKPGYTAHSLSPSPPQQRLRASAVYMLSLHLLAPRNQPLQETSVKGTMETLVLCSSEAHTHVNQPPRLCLVGHSHRRELLPQRASQSPCAGGSPGRLLGGRTVSVGGQGRAGAGAGESRDMATPGAHGPPAPLPQVILFFRPHFLLR